MRKEATQGVSKLFRMKKIAAEKEICEARNAFAENGQSAFNEAFNEIFNDRLLLRSCERPSLSAEEKQMERDYKDPEHFSSPSSPIPERSWYPTLLIRQPEMLTLIAIEEVIHNNTLVLSELTDAQILGELDKVVASNTEKGAGVRVQAHRNCSCINFDVLRTMREVPYDVLFENKVAHIGAFVMKTFTKPLGFGAFHHAVYMGGSLVVEGTIFQGDAGKNVLTVAPNSLYNEFKFGKGNSSAIYKFDYDNRYSEQTLRRRAVWALGSFDYDLIGANCENVTSWVFSNWQQCYPEHELVQERFALTQYLSDGFIRFWRFLMRRESGWLLKFGVPDDYSYDGSILRKSTIKDMDTLFPEDVAVISSAAGGSRMENAYRKRTARRNRTRGSRTRRARA